MCVCDGQRRYCVLLRRVITPLRRRRHWASPRPQYRPASLSRSRTCERAHHAQEEAQNTALGEKRCWLPSQDPLARRRLSPSCRLRAQVREQRTATQRSTTRSRNGKRRQRSHALVVRKPRGHRQYTAQQSPRGKTVDVPKYLHATTTRHKAHRQDGGADEKIARQSDTAQ